MKYFFSQLNCFVVILFLSFHFLWPTYSYPVDSSLWDTIKLKGHIILIRHALAPGIGDPPEFVLRDCSTQRNLSVEGKKQAEKIGQLFRKNGIRDAALFSSQWCRCLETAELLQLGPVKELPLLNSFFNQPEKRVSQTSELKAWMNNIHKDNLTILITHQVNITALTGVYPSSGEIVVVRFVNENEYQVLGTIQTH